MPETAPYGSWKSPITSDLVTAGAIRTGDIQVDGETVYWSESRPSDGGRSVIVRLRSGQEPDDVTHAPFNARTRVHEYGGGAFTAHDGIVYSSNFADQRLYRIRSGSEPEALTPAGGWRFADAQVDPRRERLICVGEEHGAEGQEPVNAVVAVPLVGGKPQTLVSGEDFYANPRLSPDGRRLAWISWRHPNMSWDSSELWTADCRRGEIVEPVRVAGGPQESVLQPEWGPDGTLYFISDRTGWWNLYVWRGVGVEPLCPMEAEFGEPQWVFGRPRYAVLNDRQLACIYSRNGVDHLALLDVPSRQLSSLEIRTAEGAAASTEFSTLRAGGSALVFRAASPTETPATLRLNLETREIQVIRHSSAIAMDPTYLSIPEAVEFPTEGGKPAYGFYYAPRNPDFEAPAGEKPPLLVLSHGGPTSASSATLSYSIQFWTSRGLAVLDVNYGGSSGYGREYRERLKGNWGIVDVDDCVNGALFQTERGAVDRDRLAIRGGSAGGYTTLCALTFRQVFRAGASHFGVSDLTALAEDTHKFESRYLDGLVGPYPEQADLYRERSPIHFAERMSCPLIVFQGLEDRVVPPSQAVMMVDAVRSRGIPVAYVPFEGEQHGFRKAENIKRSLEAELYFYSRIFGFKLAEDVEPVEIHNMPDPPERPARFGAG